VKPWGVIGGEFPIRVESDVVGRKKGGKFKFFQTEAGRDDKQKKCWWESLIEEEERGAANFGVV